MKANGRKINKMVMGKNFGLMKQCIRDFIKMEKNMERECFYGRTTALIKEIFLKTIFKDSANIFGRMEGPLRDNGKRIKCMAAEFLLGLMEESMKVNTRMIKNKDTEYLHFVTVEYMKENGKMENSMVKVYFVKRALLEKVSGKMDNVYSG